MNYLKGNTVDSGEYSTLNAWKNLKNRNKNIPYAAIIFRANKINWPADLFIDFHIERGIDRFHNLDYKYSLISKSKLDSINIYIYNIDYSDDLTLELSLGSSVMLGKLISKYKEVGLGCRDHDWEGLEIVFRSSIDSKQIYEVIPLYQTNKEFKSSQ